MNDLISVNRLESDQEQFANSIIQSRGAELPATIEEIIPVLAFSKAKMEAFKALSDAAQKVSEQQELNEAALASGQRWGIVHLYGQKRLGEITREMPRAGGKGTPQEIPRKYRQLSSSGVEPREASDAERIAANPEILDRVIEKAKETGDIPTKTGVLKEIKNLKEKERKEKAIAEGRTQKTELELRIEEQEYIQILESIILKLPKTPPQDWSDQFFGLAKGYANIIINRLEVFNG